MLNFQNAYYFDEDDTIDSRINNSISNIMNAAEDSKGFKLYRDMREESFAKEFRNFVNYYLNSKIETKMDKIYQRENDENKKNRK